MFGFGDDYIVVGNMFLEVKNEIIKTSLGGNMARVECTVGTKYISLYLTWKA